MDTPATRKARHLLLAGALALGAAASLVPGSAAVRNREISFDGGLNAQVARTLAERHRYATTYHGLHDFDHRVQTGPAVIVPTAVAFRLLGVNATTAQLANLGYLVALFLLAVVLCWRLSGPLAAFLAVPVLLGTPRLFQLGLGLYGEVPALVFLLAAILLLDRLAGRPSLPGAFLTGLALGLAVQTKFQMLLPAGAVAAVLARWAFRHRDVRRAPLLLSTAAGFAAALLPLELFKVHTFGLSGFLLWWRHMLGRSLAQGTSFRMPNTTTGLHRPASHLEILARQTELPTALLALFLFLTPVLLAALLHLLGRERTLAGRSPEGRMAALAALGGAGLSLTAWWLLLSPTSHAWLRRVLNGLIPLELVALASLVELGRRLLAGREPSPASGRGRAMAVALVLVAQALSLLAWTWIPRLDRQVAPSPLRLTTGAMVEVINGLPRDATLYARGWYQAPVLAALTGRTFLDLDRFPIERYRQPLEGAYFIADAAMARNRPEDITEVLRRAGAVLVARKGSNTLYRITRLCPYPPLPEPADPRHLRSVFRPGEGPYALSGGLVEDSITPGAAHAVCGFLLRRGGASHLQVTLVPTGHAGPEPTLEIRLDGTELWRGRVPGGERFSTRLALPTGDPPGPGPCLVEIALWRDGPAPPFSLWNDDAGLLIVEEVGFPQEPGATGNGTGTP